MHTAVLSYNFRMIADCTETSSPQIDRHRQINTKLRTQTDCQTNAQTHLAVSHSMECTSRSYIKHTYYYCSMGQGQEQRLGAVGAESHNLSFSATFRIIWCLPHIFACFNIFCIISHRFSHPAYFCTILIFVWGIIIQENLILHANLPSGHGGSWAV